MKQMTDINLENYGQILSRLFQFDRVLREIWNNLYIPHSPYGTTCLSRCLNYNKVRV